MWPWGASRSPDARHRRYSTGLFLSLLCSGIRAFSAVEGVDFTSQNSVYQTSSCSVVATARGCIQLSFCACHSAKILLPRLLLEFSSKFSAHLLRGFSPRCLLLHELHCEPTILTLGTCAVTSYLVGSFCGWWILCHVQRLRGIACVRLPRWKPVQVTTTDAAYQQRFGLSSCELLTRGSTGPTGHAVGREKMDFNRMRRV